MSRGRLHVAGSLLTGRIYAGHVAKDGRTWLSDQTDVTGEACGAVVEKALKEDGITIRSGDDEYRISVVKTAPTSPTGDRDHE